MPSGTLSPCHGCGAVVTGKARVRIGNNLEGYFCPACAPLAREAASARIRSNGRRWARTIYLATRRAA